MTHAPRLGRREALTIIGGLGFGALVAACSSSSRTTAPPGSSTAAASSPTSNTPRGTAGSPSCALAPEVTQGPYFLSDHPNASNLIQDRPGRHLVLTLAVVDQQCKAIPSAKVDVWHCDAMGVYGGIGSGQGGSQGGADFGAAARGTNDTWLQGYQVAGHDGTVKFTTIYPGWYPGRAVHIHVKVFVGGRSIHTGQLYFPDDLSASVFANAPYRGAPDTTNAADSIYGESGSAALLAPTTVDTSSYAAHAQLVVQA